MQIIYDSFPGGPYAAVSKVKPETRTAPCEVCGEPSVTLASFSPFMKKRVFRKTWPHVFYPLCEDCAQKRYRSAETIRKQLPKPLRGSGLSTLHDPIPDSVDAESRE